MAESSPRKLKRVVIREEYVALTGNYVRAVLLHQLEYRQKCAFDCDRYVAEEGARLGQEGVAANVVPASGWFYKKAAELAAETMLDLDETTIRRHLKCFVRRGWLQERRNPRRKWDRTMQYRLDLVRLKADLEVINYQLEGWRFDEALNPLAATTGELQLRCGAAPVGSGETQLRSGKMPEQYQNTQIKHLAQHTHHRAKAESCVSGSRFSPSEIVSYVEACVAQGQQVRGGLAIWLQQTGKGDHLIAAAAAQAREQPTKFRAQEPKTRHTHDCPRCFGAQMEIIPGKGARPCTYVKPTTSAGERVAPHAR